MLSNEALLLKVRSILVSQPNPDNPKNPYAELVQKYGLKIDFRPFIKVEPVSAKDFRKETKINVPDFTSVIFNSKNAIDNYFRICEEIKFQPPAETKFFCISESVGVYVQRYNQLRKRKSFFGKGKLDDLMPFIQKHKTEKFLLPSSDISQGEFKDLLKSNDINVFEAVMYKTVSSDLSDLEDVKYDIICFFSPAGIKSLFENFPDFVQGNTRIAAFGSTTQAAVQDRGLVVNIAAPAPGAPSMTMAIEQYVKKANNVK